MDSLESQKGPEPIRDIFRKQAMEVDALIENEYQSKKTPTEARVDALIFAASQLSWWKVSCLIDPDSEQEDIEDSDKMAIQWENAIEGAKNNDWTAMKAVLQVYARSSFVAAATREVLRETNPSIAPGDKSQKRADAFVNLISSL